MRGMALISFNRLAAAKARDYLPWFVFGLFSGSHAAKIRLKSICFQYGCVSHHQKVPVPGAGYWPLLAASGPF